jgi:hypothetical protein
MTTKLRDRTIELLKNRPASLQLKDIAKATEIPEGWLKMLVQGKIIDPGVNRVQTVFEFLTKQPLLKA